LEPPLLHRIASHLACLLACSQWRREGGAGRAPALGARSKGAQKVLRIFFLQIRKWLFNRIWLFFFVFLDWGLINFNILLDFFTF
jgi:hypothetical protein